MANLRGLHHELADGSYQHGGYAYFKVRDPKPRDIHKARVRDRVIHHALYDTLYPYFDRRFIHDSYSCRVNKGTHRALRRFEQFARRASGNNTRTVWTLKLDIRRCFASIDHDILLNMLRRAIHSPETMRVVYTVIHSFNVERPGVGIPLGNLTSQLFVNIYLDVFDQFVKGELREPYYIRYADDMVIFSRDRAHLESLITQIRDFLRTELRLELHPQKVSIRTVASGVDFLGWVHFPDHRVLRTSTKRRMLKRTSSAEKNEATVQSYLGLLSHGNSAKLRERVERVLTEIGER